MAIGRRQFVSALGGAAVAWPFGAVAQTGRKVPLIGCLYAGQKNADTAWILAFLSGMRDLGYVEGQGFNIAYNFADGDYTRLTALAAELESLKPEVILAAEPPAAGAAARATSSIPIVSPILFDPVKTGLVASYAHPNRNVTGILVIVQGLLGKEIELLREVVPGATTIGALFNPTNPSSVLQRQEVEAVGGTNGLKIIITEASAKSDLDTAFDTLVAAKVQVVLVLADPMFISQRERIASLAAASHLPTIANAREFVEAGALMNYGVSLSANFYRAAYFVDKILKGEKPADLPVEFPTKIEMIINLKTAKALGIDIPASVKVLADEVIE
jgi:putative ABC transport system substrate-binding protein